MAQIKIYGHAAFLNANRSAISDTIHACAMTALGLPADKRFHRFIPLESADFIHPTDRTGRYLIIEVSLFEGRQVETKKNFIRALFKRFAESGLTSAQDLEITLTETPRHNWGIRGLPADELTLNYKVEK
ncbi:MAG: tautomerase family protein [Opitutaceae bacterium]|nr:tautomerase family protein [Opitutaceae bacterium]MBP9913312.1 tautomerase family protein [Opitutaceae bacterium]